MRKTRLENFPAWKVSSQKVLLAPSSHRSFPVTVFHGERVCCLELPPPSWFQIHSCPQTGLSPLPRAWLYLSLENVPGLSFQSLVSIETGLNCPSDDVTARKALSFPCFFWRVWQLGWNSLSDLGISCHVITNRDAKEQRAHVPSLNPFLLPVIYV